MLPRLTLAFSCLVAAAGAHAADTSYDDMLAKARVDCAKAAPAWPARDRPPAGQARCDAKNAYYGIGEPVDYAKARACAFQAKDEQNDNDVLAMLYANGQGVARNFALARKAVCDAQAAPMEYQGRLEHLARMEAAKGAKPETFDYCDDISSGAMMSYCASVRADLAQQTRDHGVAALSASWPAAQKAALATLRRHMETWVKARDGEIDLSGTARGEMLTEAEDAVHEEFAVMLASAEKGRIASVTPAHAKAVDDKLNATWKRVRAVSEDRLGTVKQDDILHAQREWLRYRDAWIVFGKLRWPAISAATWSSFMAEGREKQLAEFVGG